MTEHTAAPWHFDGLVQIVEAARPHMRVAFLPSDHAEYASSKPNGHLIAAAPDLLAALRGDDPEAPKEIQPLSWLKSMIEYCKERGPFEADADPNSFWDMVSEVETLHKRATAAVARAVMNADNRS